METVDFSYSSSESKIFFKFLEIVDAQQDTIEVSLMQTIALFETDKSGISSHINNIYKLGELSKKGTIAKFAIV